MPVWGDREPVALPCVGDPPADSSRRERHGGGGGVSLARTRLSPAPPPRPPPPAPPAATASTRPQEPCWPSVTSRSAALSLSPP